MRTYLAIDPGPVESGWCVIDEAHKPHVFGKQPNEEILREVRATAASDLAIEMVASYGMAVGREVFETCVWIGRFLEASEDNPWIFRRQLIYRRDVKLHHCGSARAKDANITQALKDRFAYGVSNHGKGTKAEPGWFHGFKADIWQAYALAVYAADTAQEAVA
jgi:hypothetical protein